MHAALFLPHFLSKMICGFHRVAESQREVVRVSVQHDQQKILLSVLQTEFSNQLLHVPCFYCGCLFSEVTRFLIIQDIF